MRLFLFIINILFFACSQQANGQKFNRFRLDSINPNTHKSTILGESNIVILATSEVSEIDIHPALIMIDTTGKFIWEKRLFIPSFRRILQVSSYGEDQILVLAETDALTSKDETNDRVSFIGLYDSNGKLVQSKLLSENYKEIIIDKNLIIYLTGFFIDRNYFTKAQISVQPVVLKLDSKLHEVSKTFLSLPYRNKMLALSPVFDVEAITDDGIRVTYLYPLDNAEEAPNGVTAMSSLGIPRYYYKLSLFNFFGKELNSVALRLKGFKRRGFFDKEGNYFTLKTLRADTINISDREKNRPGIKNELYLDNYSEKGELIRTSIISKEPMEGGIEAIKVGEKCICILNLKNELSYSVTVVNNQGKSIFFKEYLNDFFRYSTSFSLLSNKILVTFIGRTNKLTNHKDKAAHSLLFYLIPIYDKRCFD